MITINGIHCLEGDSHITNDIRRTGTLKWDPTFEKILQHIGAGNGRTMVDVGAYIGDSTKWFEDAGFKCHAFEPMPDAFECLQKNAHPDTICDNVAIGNGQTYATTTEAEGNLGGRSLIVNGGGEISLSLDLLFPDGIDVLKIDAEGFEPFILEGAKETLKKKPIVIIEINEEALSKFGFSGQDILKHLEGYEFEEVYRYGSGQYDLVCFPKKQVLVCSGRFGDLYMICKAVSEPSIVFTSQDFAGIVKELFPQHELFVVGKAVSGIVEMMQLAQARYPNHHIVPAQQNGMPLEVRQEFRNYEEYQRWQAGYKQSEITFTPTKFTKAVIFLDGVSSGIFSSSYLMIKRNIIQGCRAMGLEVIEYQNQRDGFEKMQEAMNQADTLYIVNDSLSYHFCDTAPVIVISRSVQWAQSSPKPNCIGRLTQEAIEQDYSELVAIIGRNTSMRQFHNHFAAKTYILYSDYQTPDIDTTGRNAMALASWVKLSKMDYDVHLLPYTSEGLPFVSDILKEGMSECSHPDDLIIFLNRDICLTVESVGIIRSFMDSRNINECYAHRVDVEFDSHLKFRDLSGQKHNWGIDLFAFRPESKVVDPLCGVPLYIGRTDWDNYWSAIVKNRLPYNVCYHAPHPELWKTDDEIIAKQNRHNQTKIMGVMPDLKFYDKVGFSGLGPIS